MLQGVPKMALDLSCQLLLHVLLLMLLVRVGTDGLGYAPRAVFGTLGTNRCHHLRDQTLLSHRRPGEVGQVGSARPAYGSYAGPCTLGS